MLFSGSNQSETGSRKPEIIQRSGRILVNSTFTIYHLPFLIYTDDSLPLEDFRFNHSLDQVNAKDYQGLHKNLAFLKEHFRWVRARQNKDFALLIERKTKATDNRF